MAYMCEVNDVLQNMNIWKGFESEIKNWDVSKENLSSFHFLVYTS